MSRVLARFSALIFAVWLVVFPVVTSASTISARIRISVCGNTITEWDEECDVTDLNGQSCQSQGFGGGTLSCDPSCSFDTSLCTTSSGSVGGGATGGGGGGATTVPVVTQVTFSGRAYPLSKVVVLKDGQVAVSTIAGPDARFEVSLTGLATGNYAFGIYGEDATGLHSALFSFPVYITNGATTRVSGIFIAPTISADKSEVKRGDNIAIFGRTAPNSEVTLAVNSENELFYSVNADATGAYLYTLNTAVLEAGSHSTQAKSALEEEASPFGKTVGFVVGTKNVTALPDVVGVKGDVNGDGKVNLVDFSIVAYWYQRELSAEFRVVEKEQLNGDGKVNLVDFSIMAYHWSG
ncbi:MAG: dockerin type I repeat-containing protein [Patescibacteria group bacterium]|jgi:hypothetical protein